jgi:uncharacterized spore protein YtfJ
MDASELFGSMQRQMDDRRVFGEPVERDGVTVIPVATVLSGAGGGLGDGRLPARPGDLDTDERPGGEGAGGGFGLAARPIGAWVIRGGEVEWKPALNLNRVIAGGQLVAGLAIVCAYLAFRRGRR